MKATSDTNERNPLLLEAQADELEAEAMQLRARAKRLRVEADVPSIPQPIAPQHMTRSQYARSRSVSEATVSRWIAEGMPSLPVGTTVRIDPTEADTWRRSRGRRPTTKLKPRIDADDVAVSELLVRGGLRSIGGAR